MSRRFKRKTDSLGPSEKVRLSRWCVEESSIDLVFGQTGAQVFQALGGILVHAGLTENPVPVTCRGKEINKQRDEKKGSKKE